MWICLAWVKLAIVSVMLTVSRVRCMYDIVYLNEACHCDDVSKPHCDQHTLRPQDAGAGQIQLSRDPEFYRHFYCQLIIQAPPNMKVQIKVDDVMIPETTGCQSAGLRFYDGLPGKEAWELAGICGGTPAEQVYRSTSSAMTLYYYQIPDVFWEEKLVNLTFTYFSITGQDGTWCNRSTEYACRNQLCVPARLKCDGYDNCADMSDEDMDYQVCGIYSRSNPAVGLAVGGTLAVFLTIGLVAALYFRRRRNRKRGFREGTHHLEVSEVELNGDVDTTVTGGNQSVVITNTRANTNDNPTRVEYHRIQALTNEIRCGSHGIQSRTATPPPSYSSLFPDPARLTS